MLLRLLPILSLAFLLSDCKSGPKVTVCVSDPAAGGFDCYNEATNLGSFIPYSQSDRFIALPPTDAQTVLNFCAQGVR